MNRIGDLIRDRQLDVEQIYQYLLFFRESTHEYAMDNFDAIAFLGLEAHDTCLFSMFVTETGVDTSQLSPTLCVLLRRINPRPYYFLVENDSPEFAYQKNMRDDYTVNFPLALRRGGGLAQIMQVGKFKQRETLELIQNALNRAWRYGLLRDYVLTREDLRAIHICNQASAVYSFTPIDFLALVLARTGVNTRNVQEEAKEEKLYAQRIQDALGGAKVDSIGRTISARTKMLQEEMENETTKKLYDWLRSLEDGKSPEDFSLSFIVNHSPYLLSFMLTTGLLTLDEYPKQEDVLALLQAWHDDKEDAYLISPFILALSGVRDERLLRSEEYLNTLTTPERILEAGQNGMSLVNIPGHENFQEFIDLEPSVTTQQDAYDGLN